MKISASQCSFDCGASLPDPRDPSSKVFLLSTKWYHSMMVGDLVCSKHQEQIK